MMISDDIVSLHSTISDIRPVNWGKEEEEEEKQNKTKQNK